MTKYDRMVATNRATSEAKIAKAKAEIAKMVSENIQVTVGELVKRTGLSRGFFYKNEEVERTLLPDYTGFSAKQMMNMTHLERFHWDVTGDCAEKECWILFDYRRRNALNQDAFIMDVTRQMRIAVQNLENRNMR